MTSKVGKRNEWGDISGTQIVELLGRRITLFTEDGTKREGFLYTVDPESGSVILLQAPTTGRACSASNEPWRLVGVFSDSIRDYFVGSQICPISAPRMAAFGQLLSDARGGIHHQVKKLPAEPATATEERKRAVISLLQEYRVPFVEADDGSLLILDSVTVSSPFTAEACSSRNEIMLAKVRGYISSHRC